MHSHVEGVVECPQEGGKGGQGDKFIQNSSTNAYGQLMPSHMMDCDALSMMTLCSPACIVTLKANLMVADLPPEGPARGGGGGGGMNSYRILV